MSVSILVVDDASDVADLFRQRFRREVRGGTHVANSGEMPLEQMTAGIDPTLIVILSDINMPGMDGLQVLEAIMQIHYGDDERRRRASDLGASEFLAKTGDFEQLKGQLRQLPPAADGVNT